MSIALIIPLIFIWLFIKHHFKSITNLLKSIRKFISNIDLKKISEEVEKIFEMIVALAVLAFEKMFEIIGGLAVLALVVCLIVWAIASGGWLAVIAILLFFLLFK